MSEIYNFYDKYILRSSKSIINQMQNEERKRRRSIFEFKQLYKKINTTYKLKEKQYRML